MKHRLPMIAAALCLIGGAANAAETAYVVDKLLVGVHQEKDLNSAIIKVLPTGTKLSVTQRDGELAEISDADGTSGWVDAAYLMAEIPAQLRVTELEKEIAALKSRPSGDGEPDGDREQLMKENTELKGKLSAEKLKVGELQAEVGTLQTKVAARPTTPADTVIEALETEKQSLVRELESALQSSKQLESQLKAQTPSRLPVAVDSFSAPVLGTFVFLLLVAFGGGIYFMDYLNRRRHGGFRV